MDKAIELAKQAAAAGEVPIGALLVQAGQVLGQGWNNPIAQNDPTSHAEIRAIREACQAAGNYRLSSCTLYVTLMPCLMCWGAILHARIERVVVGCMESRYSLEVPQLAQIFNTPDKAWGSCGLETGCMATECQTVLGHFFKSMRQSREEVLAGLDSLASLPNINSTLQLWLAAQGYSSGQDLLLNGLKSTANRLKTLPGRFDLPDKEQAMLLALCHYLEGNPVQSWRHFFTLTNSETKSGGPKN